ncbi:cytochrome P450 71A1-like [Tasmannia lanceolata]|uniref:cytochrome P450 71A1-like n=1 Tax=Tasmannia lanceolata TaxID=3420 RepID=UPI0040629489
MQPLWFINIHCKQEIILEVQVMAVLLADSLSLSFLLLLPFVLHFVLRRFNSVWADKPNLPPSPFKLPFIGNLHQLGSLPHSSLRSLTEKHGPLMFLQLGQVPTLVVSSAKLVHEIVKTNDIAFSGRAATMAAKQLTYGCNDVTFSPYGDYWRAARKICVVELLSAKRVQLFQQVREEEVCKMIEKISHSCSVARGASINLSEMFLSLTNDIISRVAFGKNCGGQGENRYAGLTREIGIVMGLFRVGDYFPSLGWIDVVTGLDARTKRAFRVLDSLFEQVIEEHLNPERDVHTMGKDFVDVMLHVQKEFNLQNSPLSKDSLKAIIMDMFAAGTETTATALDWAMAELVRNPTVIKKAQEEVRRVVGKNSKVQEEDIQGMDYLKSIITETLRLHPPFPLLLPRETILATNLQGYHIPPHTRVIINAWAIGRDPDSWDNAQEFCPERFINNDFDFKGKKFEMIPFGLGRRGCPGISFSISSMELVLANLLYCFDWELPDSENKGLDMTEAAGLTVHRNCDLHLVPMLHFL